MENFEQETLISFAKGENKANIFTYEKAWQKHLEGKLGLKPIRDNGFGGREYELPKRLIRPPRAPRALTPAARERARAAGMALARRNRPKTQARTLKSGEEPSGQGNPLPRQAAPVEVPVKHGNNRQSHG